MNDRAKFSGQELRALYASTEEANGCEPADSLVSAPNDHVRMTQELPLQLPASPEGSEKLHEQRSSG